MDINYGLPIYGKLLEEKMLILISRIAISRFYCIKMNWNLKK